MDRRIRSPSLCEWVRRSAAPAALAIALAWPVAAVPDDSRPAPVTRASPEKAAGSVTSNDKHAGVRLRVENEALWPLLQRVEGESGIRFKVPGDLKDMPITASISAPDWTAAVRMLLGNFNKVEILDADDRLEKVVVMGGNYDKDNPPFIGYGAEPSQDDEKAQPWTTAAREGTGAAPVALDERAALRRLARQFSDEKDGSAKAMSATEPAIERAHPAPVASVDYVADPGTRYAPPGQMRARGLGPPVHEIRSGARDGPPLDKAAWRPGPPSADPY